jgi:glycosyltransferase involved in cell wall biosynthesis
VKKLVYFSPVFWSSYKQRPHFVIEKFLQQGYEVLWVEPYPVRLPRLEDFFRSGKIHQQGTPLEKNVSLIKLPALPIEPLPGINILNQVLLCEPLKKLNAWLQEGTILGIGKPCKLALHLLQQHRGISFYDAMDDFPEFHRGLSRWHIQQVESKIAREVSQLIVSSTFLANKFSNANKNLVKIFNAADFSVLLPPLMQQNKSTVLGYIGTLGAWFDWDLVCQMANRFPQFTFRLIGPCFTKSTESLPANIEILPPCPHQEIGKYLRDFSAGLIPFKLNALTIGVDPIKYYEYAAMGLPILTTNFGEMHYRDKAPGVYIINSANIEEALSNAMNYQPLLESVISFRKENSWEARLEKFVSTIEKS